MSACRIEGLPMSYFRDNIEAMEGYAPGEQPREAGFLKLNTNESPYPPSEKVLRAVRDGVNDELRLYPDPLSTAVRRKVAEVFDTQVERVIAGNGSDDILTMILRALGGPGRTVAFPTPTYSLYPTLCAIENCRVRAVPFPPDFSLPGELAEANAHVTLVANPNSPSGTTIPVTELDRLARALDGVLVVDEAYVDFAEEDALRLARDRRNVIVLRTFSKSFSLCGLRLGFGVAHPELVAGLMKVKDSYNVNRLAQIAGVAALDDLAAMRANAARIRDTRARLTRALEALGWFVHPSQGNFVFARVCPPGDARDIYERLKARRILVRYFDQPGLDDGLRITVGSDAEIDALLRALRTLRVPDAT
jgi:histidinol-phosphate aminotransferase